MNRLMMSRLPISRLMVMLCMGLGLASLVPPGPASAEMAASAQFTTVSLPTNRIVVPAGEPSGLVVLLSDANGWTGDEERIQRRLVDRGGIVVGIDLPAYLAALRRETRDCLYLVSDIEKLGRQIHRAYDIKTFHPPIVAGWGEGATLALAILAQTPNTTVAETVAVDPQAVLPLVKPLCTPAEKTPDGEGMVYGLKPAPLPDPLSLILSPAASERGRSHALGLKAAKPEITLEDSADTAAILFERESLAALDRMAASRAPLDLPIIELPAEPRFDTLAIIYSGDGGWRDIDQKLGGFLQADGVPVIGVDALRYFWQERSPDQTAADLSRIIATYRQRFGVKNVVLVGYSFGADILPATYNRLPPADRAVVTQLSLLALSRKADFEIAVTGWLGMSGSGKHGDPVVHLSQIEPAKIQCIHGEAEQQSGCKALSGMADAQVITRPGGHHFDGNYKLLSDLVLARLRAGFDRRS
ncbi:AcvB/VirJ family lysyl-phosphatidylglycerol hydrolase [Rhizobium sp. 18065]|uniref:AcvB/VirJ family lysyl-phosphatidylglycerol hydrolase n=1 Tax=Rhizobium sp. 18065 TaxID=2681411 RepID=UPI001FCF0FD6|nr:AcvB/VirJ family lysyl-phosphatidylglycerol hydrolase [Rhizobium sp. 18065]